ncbi:MAG: RES family NAD+ phosphorylase [Actinoallomurus sp.]
MPKSLPPDRFDARPHMYKIEAGRRLWRVHHKTVEPTGFTMRLADENFGGGRFDATARDPYSFFYAGLEAGTALNEVLLRDVIPNAKGTRVIRRRDVRDRRISVVHPTTDLNLVSLLTGPALAAVRQDTWLTQATEDDYHATRRWASWIRRTAPDADGLVWPSKREGTEPSLMLFGDRCADSLVVGSSSIVNLDDAVGAVWINALLTPYQAWIASPRPSLCSAPGV